MFDRGTAKNQQRSEKPARLQWKPFARTMDWAACLASQIIALRLGSADSLVAHDMVGLLTLGFCMPF
jgi:hypothetical protein